MIETNRLKLRPLKTSDYIELVPLFSDPQVMKSSLNGTKTAEDVKSWVAQKVEETRTNSGIEIFVESGQVSIFSRQT